MTAARDAIAAIVAATDADKVSLSLSIVSDRRIRIEQIWSERERRTGHASTALRTICRECDARAISIELQAYWLAYDIENPEIDDAECDRLHALNELKLGNADLAAWYGRHGFVTTKQMEDCVAEMERLP